MQYFGAAADYRLRSTVLIEGGGLDIDDHIGQIFKSPRRFKGQRSMV